MATPPRQCITVITPVYNEQESVEDCYRAVRQVFERELPEFDCEHIFADNHSSDETVAVLRRLAETDPQVKVILNARNFGILRSTFNALLSATGDAVVVLFPVDLQDPPELIAQFVRKWKAGYEVVYGIRNNREESRLMRSIRRAYYRLVSRLADIQIPEDVGSFQLVDRRVIEALRQCDDFYPHIPGMIASCGFRSAGIPYTWRARAKGRTKNRLYHLVDEGLNGLISFSRVPMRLCMFAGLMLSAVSIAYAVFSLLITLVRQQELVPPGIPTLIIAIFFFSGVQLFFFGVLGEYISAIHCQVRKRPLVVERERINFNPHRPPAGPADRTPPSAADPS
jgi:glycosyltransferase involved in cell wall biosynthesis